MSVKIIDGIDIPGHPDYVDDFELEVAEEMFNQLSAGTFYKREEEAREFIKNFKNPNDRKNKKL